MVQHNYTQWTLPKLSTIKKIILNGTGNIVDLNVFFPEAEMHILGKNNLKVISQNYKNLYVFTTYSEIDFWGGICDNLVLKVEGNGYVKNLTVLKFADVNNVGSTDICLNKLHSTVRTEMINGTGKVVWTNVVV
jgi:hypothetical protein